MTATGGRVRRRVWDKHDTELQSRQTQASRASLRRHHKVKQARIVKKHVLYKQKRRLLQQLSEQDEPAPVIASELGRPGGDSDNEEPPMPIAPNVAGQGATTDGNIEVKPGQSNSEQIENSDVDNREKSFRVEASKSQQGGNGSDENTGHESLKGDRKRGKYVPFAKQIREYEAWKRQREEEKEQREENIRQREEMLEKSQKRRKEQVCTFRLFRPPRKVSNGLWQDPLSTTRVSFSIASLPN